MRVVVDKQLERRRAFARQRADALLAAEVVDPDDVAGLDLGAAITTDECVTSLYGDTKLFFKHQYIDDDKEAKPEWAEAYDKECTSFCGIPT